MYNLSGGEGETCLRSSDCVEGLCCARHFWSRICKPVLTEGQVCTRHRRKGAQSLEIFQRCDCGSGLTCRGQREKPGGKSRNLHTCQPRWPRRTALCSTHTHTMRTHGHTHTHTHTHHAHTWTHTHTMRTHTHTHTMRTHGHTCSSGTGKLIPLKDAPIKGLIVFPGRMQRNCTVEMFLVVHSAI